MQEIGVSRDIAEGRQKGENRTGKGKTGCGGGGSSDGVLEEEENKKATTTKTVGEGEEGGGERVARRR